MASDAAAAGVAVWNLYDFSKYLAKDLRPEDRAAWADRLKSAHASGPVAMNAMTGIQYRYLADALGELADAGLSALAAGIVNDSTAWRGWEPQTSPVWPRGCPRPAPRRRAPGHVQIRHGHVPGEQRRHSVG